MKKFLSILMTVLLVFSCGVVFAEGEGGGAFAPLNPATNVGGSGMRNIANTVVGAIRIIGYFIAAGMIVFIGIKYIMASASEKAELKGLLVKYVIGAALIVFGTQIAAWIFSITAG